MTNNMTLAERCRIHAVSMDGEGWYVTGNVLDAAATELDRQAKEIMQLRLAIYRAVDHNTTMLDRPFLQGIIAEFEPNYVP
jgi:hypothetical protein